MFQLSNNEFLSPDTPAGTTPDTASDEGKETFELLNVEEPDEVLDIDSPKKEKKRIVMMKKKLTN
jgi:hypothetical protein